MTSTLALHATGKSIKDMTEALTQYKPQLAVIRHSFARIAAGEEVTDRSALKAMVDRGYIEMMPRAKRYRLTAEGKKFYRAMKRYGYLA